MKHGQLCAIAHNLADSMASGLGFVIGHYPMDVFGEAGRSDGGTICVDFLSGKITRGHASKSLQRAAALYAKALPDFCRQHGPAAGECIEMSASFSRVVHGPRVTITVADKHGHRSVTEYEGAPLRRVRVLDPLGRIRRKPRKAVSA